MIYRLVGYAQPQGYGDSFYATGSKVDLPASITGQQHALRITTPRQGGLLPDRRGPAGPELAFAQTDTAGIYTVAADSAAPSGGEPDYLLAVNIPRAKSRTTMRSRRVVVDPNTTVWFDAPEGAAREIRAGPTRHRSVDMLCSWRCRGIGRTVAGESLSRPAALDDRAAAGRLSDPARPMDEARLSVAGGPSLATRASRRQKLGI